MNSPAHNPSRRRFLGQCCAGVGATGILSTLAQLRMMGAVAGDSLPSRAAAVPSDYKALVCLFLNGGNDGNSVIVPTEAAAYGRYATARGALAVPQTSLLALAPRAYNDGLSYGLHPSFAGLHPLFGQGKAAVLANVGTLAQPTTLAQYKSGKALPAQLFSHSDQTEQWMSSIADKPFETGWGGRVADLVNAMNGNPQISMSITLSGANRFQVGNQVSQYAVGTTGATALTGSTSGATSASGLRYAAMKNLFASPSANLLEAAFGMVGKEAVGDAETLTAALRGAAVLQTPFPTSATAIRLAMIARLISVASTLGVKRQIFFVQLGGWDLHGGQADGHAPLLAETSAAMAAFYQATVELGVANQVTTFTASDFGRTYAPNAGGTDHGWGNHQLVVGGAVKGGDIYGQMPNLTINGPDDAGRGRWIPSTSVDEYNATLATWFGVSASNLSTVLPNIGRFAKPNLGFMT